MFFVAPAFSDEKAIEKTQPYVSKINVEILSISGDKTRWKKIAKSFIFIKEGKPFSPQKLQQTIEALKLSDMFQNIHVPDPEWGQDNITLTFQLTPFNRIKAIKIDGAFPVFEQEILKVMTLNPGDAFKEKKLSEQKTAIARILIKEGYIDPDININAEKDPKDGHIILRVHILKGDFYRIKKVGFNGKQSFSATRLKFRMSAWHSSLLFGGLSRLVEKKLKDDAEKLTRFYRHKGFAQTIVIHKVEKNPITKEAVITFHINEGPKYHVQFNGNKAFWNITLKKDLVFHKEGDKNNFGLNKSLRNIKKRYRKAGYLKAETKSVDNTILVKGKPIRKIRIIIKEGLQSIVRSLTIKGNSKIGEEEIKKQLLTEAQGRFTTGEFVPKTMAEDIKAVKSLYFKHGFMNTKIKEKIQWQTDKQKNKNFGDIELFITEGEQSRISSLAIKGLKVVPMEEAEENLALKPGETFRNYMIKSDENSLAAMISEKGYPHVKVTGTVILKNDKTEAELTYAVNEGPYVEIEDFFYKGNFRTQNKVFEREREINLGDPFSLTKLLKTQRNILDLGPVKSARFNAIGLKEKEEKVNVLVTVEEKKPYFLEFSAGYDSERQLYVHSRGGDRNLFGLNKSLEGGLDFSQIGYRGDIGVTQPRLFGLNIASTSSIFAEKKEELNQDFGTDSFGALLGFSKSFFGHLSVSFNSRYEYRKQFQIGDNPAAPTNQDEFEGRSILVSTPALIYNTADSHVRPTKGIFSSLSVDISKGLENSLDDFIKYRLEAKYYYSPQERLTFAIRARYGFIGPYGSGNTISQDQLFYLGGVSDVRGFSENKLRFDAAGDPVGGRGETLGSLEARIDMGFKLDLTLFYDVGRISNISDSAASDEFRSSTGLGIGYLTPIGPIGFLYGWKLNKKDGESAGRLHFSLGYTF